MRRALAAVGLAGVLALAGCAEPTTGEVAASALDEAGVEVGSTWVLVSGQVDGEDLRLLPDHPITFSRTEDGVEGQSSCNTYSETDMEGETANGRVFPGLANTAKGCPEPGGEESLDNPIMDLEEQYLGALYATTEVERSGDGLMLRGPDATLTFERGGTGEVGRPPSPPTSADPPTHTSAIPVRSTWILQSGTLDGEPLPLLDGHPIRLFHDHGEVTGQSACNGYRGVLDG